MKTYVREVQIRFHEADPAGILYFGNILTLAHDTFEDFIVEAGIPWKTWFKDCLYFVPIKYVESDFKAPFIPGEKYQVHTQVGSITESSFQMQYTFQQGEKVHAIVKMVHTFADMKTKQKTRMPDDVRQVLNPYWVK